MAKRKAESQDQLATKNGTKKIKQEPPVTVKAEKSKMMLDDGDSSSEDDSVGGAPLEAGFKREELQRLEEKYTKKPGPTIGRNGEKKYGDKYDEDSSSSDDEDEDDEGFLATEDLDKEISATLQALRSKDPRVYDEKVTFYSPIDEDAGEGTTTEKKEKPMYLKDYHRQKFTSWPYRRRGRRERPTNICPGTRSIKKEDSRAWVPSDGARFQPLESDDEEEDDRAEQFETAYNLRFENPAGSNEMLKSYARDVVAEKSVRRDEVSSRKKARDAAREKKEAEKKEREEERSRLKRLKIEEMEERLQKIKKAAGLSGKVLKDEEWEGGSDSDDETGGKKKKKVKKPKWEDDIDIKDLIPEFDDEEGSSKPAFSLSDIEDDAEDDAEDNSDDEGKSSKKSKSNKERQLEKQAKKKAARLERKKIEDLVDSKLDVDLSLASKKASEIYLMAPDSSLNKFAGLKKMATFRDAEKKRKDKKHLGKKARLRQWRKETFGNEDGPEIIIGPDAGEGADAMEGVEIPEKEKKRDPEKNKGAVGRATVEE
ncbi:hypothetical protein EYC84_007798 [Monilinia fructicola]|uniref:Kri1-like C-terminal domain-containing protein n=1 Tax=Monilinia fructicola TaxID=38448 RepID=A0A5M9JP89_MONFR|nr:hypothetical protein EYC84_007798 [Monilinia fructicola]